jgi:AcrR family transcriptional regulator
MQEKSVQTRRRNEDRTAQTRKALIEAAREHFVRQGYAGTSTPEIVEAAKVTRGALYHHFADKKELFRAVVMAEMAAVAEAIEAVPDHVGDALSILLAGANAYFDAMQVSGRTLLLLVEAPSVLGLAEISERDGEAAQQTLRQGLASLLGKPAIGQDKHLEMLTLILSAAFDRAALAINDGEPRETVEAAIAQLLRGIARGDS